MRNADKVLIVRERMGWNGLRRNQGVGASERCHLQDSTGKN